MKAPDLTSWQESWELDGGEEQMHITPVNDLVAHELGQHCVCGPYVEHLGGSDWLVVHHALDGRE